MKSNSFFEPNLHVLKFSCLLYAKCICLSLLVVVFDVDRTLWIIHGAWVIFVWVVIFEKIVIISIAGAIAKKGASIIKLWFIMFFCQTFSCVFWVKVTVKVFWSIFTGKKHVFRVVVSNIFYFHPYLGKIPILTNIFQRGRNHQPGLCSPRYFSTWSNMTIFQLISHHFLLMFMRTEPGWLRSMLLGYSLQTWQSRGGFWSSNPPMFFFMQFTNMYRVFLIIEIYIYIPAPSKGCQLNPKGWQIDTLFSEPFGTQTGRSR